MISLVAISVLFFSAARAGKIKVCVAGSEAGILRILSGAQVKCYDEDTIGNDDHMGTGTTGSDGCVTISYTTKKPKFGKACHGWDWCANNPDIYCRATKGIYYKAYSMTSVNKSQSSTLNINIIMFIDRVERGDEGNANGCGPSSMSKFGRDVGNALTGFEDQCKNHDLCYESCKETQKTCDDEFAVMMYSKCNDKWDHKTVGACYSKVAVLYAAVREAGKDSFDGARDHCGRRLLDDASPSDPIIVADRLVASME